MTVTFDDNSITETSFQLQRTADGTTWTNVGTPLVSPLDLPNTTQTGLVLTDSGVSGNPGPIYGYRVAAVNTVGYGGDFPSVSAQSVSDNVLSGGATATVPAAPTNLTAALAAGPQVNLSWSGQRDQRERLRHRTFLGRRRDLHPDRHSPGPQQHRERDLR